jgi:hypothetical protein
MEARAPLTSLPGCAQLRRQYGADQAGAVIGAIRGGSQLCYRWPVSKGPSNKSLDLRRAERPPLEPAPRSAPQSAPLEAPFVLPERPQLEQLWPSRRATQTPLAQPAQTAPVQPALPFQSAQMPPVQRAQGSCFATLRSRRASPNAYFRGAYCTAGSRGTTGPTASRTICRGFNRMLKKSGQMIDSEAVSG